MGEREREREREQSGTYFLIHSIVNKSNAIDILRMLQAAMKI